MFYNRNIVLFQHFICYMLVLKAQYWKNHALFGRPIKERMIYLQQME